MNGICRLTWLMALPVVVAVSSLQNAAAQAVPEVTWTASTPGEGVAEQLAPGYTTFTVINDADAGYTLSIDKLKEGATLEATQAAYTELDQAFASSEGNVNAAINKALELLDAVTEASAAPGARQSVGIVLEPGEYVLNGTLETEQGSSERVYRTLTVSGEPQAAAPAADVTVQLSDFAITLPETLEAGSQTWQVSNLGRQIHHVVLFKLNEGATMDDFMGWMSSEQGPPPAQDAGYVGVASTGQMSYHTLDFTPGNYVAICFLPDHAAGGDGAPHFTHGMIRNFEVASN